MKTKKRLLSILLSLVLILGLMPGMSLTAYAAETTVTWDYATFKSAASGFVKDQITFTTTYKSGGNLYDGTHTFTVPAGMKFKKIEFATTSTDMSGATAYSFHSTQDGYDVKGQKVTWTGDSESVTFSGYAYAVEYVQFTIESVVAVDSVTLDQTTATLTVGGEAVKLTATVSPDNATDKKVKWSTDSANVKLYTDTSCITEVGTDATDTLTVYAKGISAGSATVTVTTNDGNKTDNCSVTVNPVTYPVTYKVVNGTWSDGSTTDKKETVADGSKPASVPTGMKASEGYTGGAWDTNPADATITGATTFTYTFTAKQAEPVGPAKLTPTLTPPTAKQNLIYTGAAQELIDAGSVTGGKLYYAVTLEQTAPADDKYDLVIPAAVEANTYYVWYKVVGDEGYSDIAPKFVPVLIAQGAFVGAPSNDALVYNGAAQALLKAGSTTFGTMAYAMGVDSVTVPTEGWSAAIPTAVNAGEYFVWYQIPGDKNHKGVDPACVRAVIAPKPIAVYAEPKAKFVGEADPALTWTVTGLLDGDTLQGALARDPGEAPGDYAINIGTLTAGPNYEIAFTGAMLTISAQPEPQPQEMFFVTLKTSGNTGFEANWTPRAGADGYDVYCGRCENGKMKLKATVKGGNVLSAKIKKLKKGKMYKVYVQAWTGTPDDKTLLDGQSTTAHAIAGGHSARWTNAKKITVKKPYVGLKPGETAKIKGKITKSKPGKDLLDHINYYRYYTDNPAVATVDDSGNITAVGFGHCTIYVMTHNGLRANVNVAVSETPAWIIFKKDAYTLKKKQSVSLADQFTLEPAGSITGPIEWTSSEPNLVSVDENGTVKALKKTKKTVTITASAGGATGSVKIKVKTK